jgi:hypothetical protein
VIAVLHARIGEPYENAIAALARIGDMQLGGKTAERIIGELNGLAAERFTDLSIRIGRLRNTLEQFERRVASGAS